MEFVIEGNDRSVREILVKGLLHRKLLVRPSVIGPSEAQDPFVVSVLIKIVQLPGRFILCGCFIDIHCGIVKGAEEKMDMAVYKSRGYSPVPAVSDLVSGRVVVSICLPFYNVFYSVVLDLYVACLLYTSCCNMCPPSFSIGRAGWRSWSPCRHIPSLCSR